MRTVLLAAMMWGCIAAPVDPNTVTVHQVEQAVAAWRADPSAVHEVSTATAKALARPVGDRDLDMVTAEALSEVLLRPDLARPRMQPYLSSLSPEQQEVWLNILLRDGDLARFASDLQVYRQVRINPAVPALIAASAQAREHRQITWKRALRAHDAGGLAERQVTYGRRSLGRNVASTVASMQVLRAMLPGWTIEAVTTRASRLTDPDPLLTAGIIPASSGTRVVTGYATSLDGDQALDDLFAALKPQGNTQSLGLVVLARGPDSQELLLCGEGAWREGVLWLDSACSPDQSNAWLNATDRWVVADDVAKKEHIVQVWRNQLLATP